MAIVTDTRTYTVVDCPMAGCGVNFALDKDFIARRRSDHGTFYCPNGHPLSYGGESDKDRAQRLAGQLDQERTRLREARESANRLSRQLDYSRRATKANATRLKKIKHRVAHGVCPCCQRTFKQLASHMSSKHPDYVES